MVLEQKGRQATREKQNSKANSGRLRLSLAINASSEAAIRKSRKSGSFRWNVLIADIDNLHVNI